MNILLEFMKTKNANPKNSLELINIETTNRALKEECEIEKTQILK